MANPDKYGRCKKHPTHNNSNGVCPNCLRHRLSNLSRNKLKAFGSSTDTESSTVYSSYDSDVSSYNSPPHMKRLFQLKSSSLSFSLSKEVGKKEKRKSKLNAGKIWEKLVMGGKGRNKQVEDNRSMFSHSKTVKEKSSSKWTFFFS